MNNFWSQELTFVCSTNDHIWQSSVAKGEPAQSLLGIPAQKLGSRHQSLGTHQSNKCNKCIKGREYNLLLGIPAQNFGVASLISEHPLQQQYKKSQNGSLLTTMINSLSLSQILHYQLAKILAFKNRHNQLFLPQGDTM